MVLPCILPWSPLVHAHWLRRKTAWTNAVTRRMPPHAYRDEAPNTRRMSSSATPLWHMKSSLEKSDYKG